MTAQELRAHPAFLALTLEEQAAVEARLSEHFLDDAAVAASTGGLQALEPSDLRAWLALTDTRPWARITLAKSPPRVEALFQALLRGTPDAEAHPQREALVEAASALSRGVVLTDEAVEAQGFLRDEQRPPLRLALERLAALAPVWTGPALAALLRAEGLPALAPVFEEDASRGVGAFFQTLGARLSTLGFDLRHTGLFLATGKPDHEGHYEGGVWRNWTRNYEARPASFQRPDSAAALGAAVAAAERVRVVGGGHSFNDSPLCAQTMLSLDALDRLLWLSGSEAVARVQGGLRLRDLNRVLEDAGFALPVLGSTDAQSIAGLVSTDLHGTGRDHGFLSEQATALSVVDAEGQAREVRPGDPLFHAAFGALGTVGVVSEVEIKLVPAFNLEKRTAMSDFKGVIQGLDQLLADNDHLSLYLVAGHGDQEALRVHTWNRTQEAPPADWERRKVVAELRDQSIAAFAHGLGTLLTSIDEDSLLSDALAPDDALIMPSGRAFGRKLFYRHDEIEYGVPYALWRDCLGEILALLAARRYFSLIEVRFTPDHSRALLGPGVGRRTAYIELATPLGQPRDEVYAAVEAIFHRYQGQPHLGKKTSVDAAAMLERYGQRFVDFQAVRRAQDPKGKFLNPFTQRVFGSV